MNVLSLCDGMSGGQIALKELSIPVENYYSSEIYKEAINVTQENFPNTIQCGSLLDLYQNEEWLKSLPRIDMILFGFPCRNTTKITYGRGKYNDGLKGSSSWLFYPCVDILNWLRENNNPKLFFFCENVFGMKSEDMDLITDTLGVIPICVNSNLFSAQDRERLYWTNIPYDKEWLPDKNESVLKDILDDEVAPNSYYKQGYKFHGMDKKVCATLNVNTHDILKRVYNANFKCATLTGCRGGYHEKKVFDEYYQLPRKLSPSEYARLQTIPNWYKFNTSRVSALNMIGDGWTIEVIKWFFRFIP